jgi:hypothetical protein
MLLVVLVSCFHRRACRPGSQTTNRFFNYSRDISMLDLKARRALRDRYESLDPFALKDELETKLKQIGGIHLTQMAPTGCGCCFLWLWVHLAKLAASRFTSLDKALIL